MRWLVALALVVGLVAVSPANAAARTGAPYYATPTEGSSACRADKQSQTSYYTSVSGVEKWTVTYPAGKDCSYIDGSGQGPTLPYVGKFECMANVYRDGISQRSERCDAVGVNTGFNNAYSTYYVKASCPSGTAWDSASGSCASQCPAGEWTDPTNPSQCLNQQKCLARNSDLGNRIRQSLTPFAACYNVGGCAFGPSSGASAKTTTVNGSVTVYQTEVAYSGANGATCAAGATPDDQKPDAAPSTEKCVAAGAGQTYCIKPDGMNCATSTTGKKFCWKQTETGTKYDGSDMQKRDAGNTPVAPNLQLPNGDSLTKKGETVTSSTSTTTNNSTTTVTTNVTNYSTVNGTNATGTSSDPKQGGETGGNTDDKGNSASGGGDCDSPPVVSGDQALSMVATQAWATRCAVEAGNAAKVTGDIGNCAQPFTVEGTNANAVKLRGMRAEICPGEKGTAPDPSTYLGDTSGDEAAKAGVFGEEKTFGSDGFDDSGLGFSRTCPTPPTFTIKGTTYTIDINKLCEWVALGGMFVLILAGMESLRVIGSGGSA